MALTSWVNCDSMLMDSRGNSRLREGYKFSACSRKLATKNCPWNIRDRGGLKHSANLSGTHSVLVLRTIERSGAGYAHYGCLSCGRVRTRAESQTRVLVWPEDEKDVLGTDVDILPCRDSGGVCTKMRDERREEYTEIGVHGDPSCA